MRCPASPARSPLTAGRTITSTIRNCGRLSRTACPMRRKVDILGCDACLMNMVEIAYEMKDAIDFMVGSEETEPAAGWPYASILQQLVANPGMKPADLSQTIARAYGEWYQRHGNPNTDGAATQSALQIDKVTPLVTAIRNLATAVTKNLKSFADPLLLARMTAQNFEYPEYLDLGDLMAQFIRRVPATSAAGKQARAVQTALSAFVTANKTWGRGVAHATGVSIYFPPTARDYSPEYENLKFSQDVHWDKLLRAVIPGLRTKAATA